VTGGSIPLNINDTVTTSSGSSTSSYLYGDLLFGGTAPVEQITTSSSGVVVTYLVSTQSGVQGVYSASGSSVEQLSYSLYGVPTITSGTSVAPFGFQGSYSDPTGLLYLINRYYDPSTDQFLSIDPLLDQTGQPYVFTNDSPLNATDPLGAYEMYRDGGGAEHRQPQKTQVSPISESGKVQRADSSQTTTFVAFASTDNGFNIQVTSQQSTFKVVVIDNGQSSGIPLGEDAVTLCTQNGNTCSSRALTGVNDAVEFTVHSSATSFYRLGNEIGGAKIAPSYTWNMKLVFAGWQVANGTQMNTVAVVTSGRNSSVNGQ